MSQLRKDPITREWVCISTDRGKDRQISVTRKKRPSSAHPITRSARSARATRNAAREYPRVRKREAQFARIGLGETRDLAMMLREALLRLDRCLDDPPYNYMILTTSFSEHFHWHHEIIPRLTIAAGFELGTGIYINIVAPEQAAADLRDASP